jgi:16S rRNA processing protein RimM
LSSSTDDRVVVGRIGKPHGLHGESTVLPSTGDAGVFAPGSILFSDDERELVVAASKPYRDRGLLLRFEGVTDRSGAEALRGLLLTIDRSERSDLDDGEFWDEDLVGCCTVDPDGAALGTVIEVVHGPGQDRLVVETGAGEQVLVPFVAAIVGEPTDDGTIVIDAPEGLFP